MDPVQVRRGRICKPRLWLAVLLWVLCLPGASAQQELLTTQWAYNKLTVNPAYAGGKDVLSARILHRQQWVGVDGRPVTTVINVHSPLLNNRMGLGLSYAHDKLGAINSHYLAFSYAYRLPFDNGTTLAFGVNAGLQTFRIETAGIEAVHVNDPLLQADLSKVHARVGTGVYFYGRKFYAGFSAPNLIPNRLYKSGDVASDAFLGDAAEQSVHLYCMAGYAFEFAEGNVVLKPQVLFKAVASRGHSAPFQADFNLSVILYERIVLGGTVRTSFRNRNTIDLDDLASADMMIGAYINRNWYIGYAYDFTLGELKQFDTGSHEIMLGLDINLKKQGVFTPRFF